MPLPNSELKVKPPMPSSLGMSGFASAGLSVRATTASRRSGRVYGFRREAGDDMADSRRRNASLWGVECGCLWYSRWQPHSMLVDKRTMVLCLAGRLKGYQQRQLESNGATVSDNDCKMEDGKVQKSDAGRCRWVVCWVYPVRLQRCKLVDQPPNMPNHLDFRQLDLRHDHPEFDERTWSLAKFK